VKHLDASIWSAYLDGSLAPGERADVKAHLAEDCEICEVRIANLAGVDRLDGLVDDALIGDLDSAPDELGFARVRSKLTKSRAWIPAVAMIAALVVAFIILPKREEERLKGPHAGAKLSVLRVESSLVFRVDLDAPTCLVLFGSENGEPREKLLEAPLCLEAGRHAIARGDDVLGLLVTHAATWVITLEDDRGAVLDRVTQVVTP